MKIFKTVCLVGLWLFVLAVFTGCPDDVTSKKELRTIFETGGDGRVQDNIGMSEQLVLNKGTYLYLESHPNDEFRIWTKEKGKPFIIVKDGATLTLGGSSRTLTIESEAGDMSNTSLIKVEKGGILYLQGRIKLSSGRTMIIENYGEVHFVGDIFKCIIDGKEKNADYGIYNAGSVLQLLGQIRKCVIGVYNTTDGTYTLSHGTIRTNNYGVVNWGKFTYDVGKEGYGYYQSEDGKTMLTDSIEENYNDGVRLRAGEARLTMGNINDNYVGVRWVGGYYYPASGIRVFGNSCRNVIEAGESITICDRK